MPERKIRTQKATFKFNMELNGERITKERYPNTDDYLGAVFEANKDVIMKRYRRSAPTIGEGLAKKAFVGSVKDIMEADNITPYKALDAQARSTAYTPLRDRGITNALHGLAQYGKYREFREMTKENGKYTKMDWQKWKMNEENEWIYDDKVKIVFSNSPQSVSLIDLTGKYKPKKQKAQ